MADWQKLKNVFLLDLLIDGELQAFAEACEETVAGEQEVIFKEDDPGDTLFLLTSGRVQISKHIVEQQEEILPAVLEGDIFGEMSFIDGTPRSSTARAMDSCGMCSIRRDRFDQLLRQEPDIGFKVMSQLCRVLTGRLRTTSEMVKQGILWNLQISGAGALGIQHLISSHADIEIHLTGGRQLSGRILLVVNTEAGCQITVKDRQGGLHIVPYGAVSTISVAESAFTQSLKD